MSDKDSSASSGGRQWGHFVFLLGILVALALYLWDSWRAQATVENLIFILPVTVVSLLIALAIGTTLFQKNRTEETVAESGESNGFFLLLISVSVFAIYVIFLPTLGFDVGTFLFVAAVLFVLGERRPVFVCLYSLAFSLLIVLGMKAMIPTNIPTLIL